MQQKLISIVLCLVLSAVTSCFSLALAQDDSIEGSDPMVASVPAQTLFYLGMTRQKAIAEMMMPLRKAAMKSLASDFADISAQANGYGQAARLLSGLLSAYDEVVAKEQFIPGIGKASRSSLYTVGIVPVLRIQLTDAEAFNTFLDHAESLGGAQARYQEYQGIAYRSYTIGPDEADFPAQLLVAVRPDFAVISLDSESFNDSVLPLALGLQAPDQSLPANGELHSVVKANDFDYANLGFLNHQAIAAALIGADDSMAAHMLDQLGMAPMLRAARDPACRDDIVELYNNWPLTALGVSKVAQTDDEGVVVHERIVSRINDADLMAELGKLRGHIPPVVLDQATPTLISLALAANMDQFASVLVDLEQRFMQAGFKCHLLTQAQQDLQQNDPISLLALGAKSVEDVQGVSLSILDVDFDAASNAESFTALGDAVDAMLVISTPQPRLLFKMAKTLEPELFGSLQLPENGESTRLFPPESAMPDVRLMASGPHLVVYLGAQAAQLAADLQDDELEPNGIFYSRFDFARLAQLALEFAPMYGDDIPELSDDMAAQIQQRLQAMDLFAFRFNSLIDIVEHGIQLDFQGTINVPSSEQSTEPEDQAPAEDASAA